MIAQRGRCYDEDRRTTAKEKFMAEESKLEQQAPQCSLCGKTSQEIPLLRGEQKGQPMWVCMHCLPMLIHGAH